MMILFSARSTMVVLLVIMLCGLQVTASFSSDKPKQVPKPTIIEPLHLKALKARSIGPAVMGGRVSSIAFDPEDPFTFYAGLGTGGVIKSTDNGASLNAIFENEAVAAIGAVAVAPSNAKYVWVGSGEANDRNSSSWGNGVYLSTDGGSEWKNVGLKESKTIAKIAVHPTDSNTAWVAAMGDLWSSGGERGLYKTTDGGKNWKLALTSPGHQSKLGCGDVVVDPSDPNVVLAALYARQRAPWSFTAGPDYTDGQDVGGIFKSTDGGSTWKKLTNGLPGRTGRIGLDIYKKNTRIMAAVVQSDEGGTSSIDSPNSKKGGVFRSEDGGETWVRVNALNPRPFYFSKIRIDPANDQRVFILGFMLHVSEDGGKSFREDFFEKVHPDCHDLRFDPRNSKRILLGTDGGIYQSFAGAKGWAHLNTVAAGEFYRIALDMSTPFRIAGGLQDNLNWVGPSRTRTKEGIVNSDWINIGGGDGFYCVFDPEDPDLVYAESQEGYVHRFNMRTGEAKGLRPEPTEGQERFRFHWNSPLIPSRFEKGTMYLGGNRVFKLTEKGEHFKIISPDLTTQDPRKTLATGSGAENYGVVYTLAESPLSAGMLWAGTDDGKLWVTTNEGTSWTDLTSYLPKAIKGQWISRIEPGSHDVKVAYLAVDGHRSGVYAPMVFRTSDGGKSWQNIAGNLPADGPVKVVREDLMNENLLFAGTEFGLYASLNRGSSWMKFGGLPTVAVDDIVIHPRDRDLVIATHGRSLFIIDDIRPLELLQDSITSKDVHVFPIRSTQGYYPLDGFADWQGASGIFRGSNPPDGAMISYFVKEYSGDPVKVSITNSADKVVANLTGPGTPGLNRISWDLKMTKDLLTDYGGGGQKFIPSGEYKVTLTFGKSKQSEKLSVMIDQGIETR